jgi:hypothetical protein
LWISEEAIEAWVPSSNGRRGAPQRYSELAIETALTLRLLFHLPLRQAEGFLRSLFDLMGLELEAPDHTSLSRRSRALSVQLDAPQRRQGTHLIVDSSGLSIVGEGEWAATKHGRKGKRGWRKLHIGVDRAGVIVAQVLTDIGGEDSVTGVELIEATAGKIKSVTGDAAYETRGIYNAAEARGGTVVVPPTRAAVVNHRKPRTPSRDRAIRRVERLGRWRWKKESGYHQQGRVENTFFRYKSILGDRLRSRNWAAQETEAIVACKLLNRLKAIGHPRSVAVRG